MPDFLLFEIEGVRHCENSQQLLGHKHISTTSGFYAFATLETLSNAIAKVDEGATKETKKWDNPEVLEKLYSL